MSRRSILVVILLLACPASLPAQRHDKEIKKREQELQRLRNDIQAYEKKLRESEKRERSTLERLDDLEQQSSLIQTLIRRLREEEARLTQDIDTARVGIADLERRLQFLQSHYANYVRSVYKNGRVYDLELLFSSKSINQLSIRIQYLKRFSEQRARDLRSIQANKDSLEQRNADLQQTLASERRLLSDKTREEEVLRRKYTERQGVLKKIRKDKRTYQKQLVRKTDAARQVEQLIADLIEKERIRKEREAAERRERELAEAREREKLKKVPPPLPQAAEEMTMDSFAERRGKLRWPVTRGTIKSKFGKQIHPVLKTVTQNTGIDIATPNGSNVYAVADGEISIVSFIPGFGNVLIINHYNGYRTVYAHLAEILVLESDRVKEGTVIARSGDTVDQPLLHFEIWKEREKQNPESWLAIQR